MNHLTFLEQVVPPVPPMLYHFHPVAFVEYMSEPKKKMGWAHSPFADLLASVESKNDYTAYNQTKLKLKSFYNTNLTTLTIKEVQEKQVAGEMFATGRFQVIPSTLNAAVIKLKLDTSLKYDEEVQDNIFEEYLIKVKKPSIIKYLEGEGEGEGEGDGDIEMAIYDWAKEWASAGVRKGKPISPRNGLSRVSQVEGESYYAGDGLNNAHISPDEMVKILKESKDNAVFYKK